MDKLTFYELEYHTIKNGLTEIRIKYLISSIKPKIQCYVVVYDDSQIIPAIESLIDKYKKYSMTESFLNLPFMTLNVKEYLKLKYEN